MITNLYWLRVAINICGSREELAKRAHIKKGRITEWLNATRKISLLNAIKIEIAVGGKVLDFGERGWLVIDPKGLLGERGFDFANIFCNPDIEIATRPGRLERQVTVVAEAADLDPTRLLRWILAYAGLSAAWHFEDGTSPELALAVADMAAVLLR